MNRNAALTMFFVVFNTQAQQTAITIVPHIAPNTTASEFRSYRDNAMLGIEGNRVVGTGASAFSPMKTNEIATPEYLMITTNGGKRIHFGARIISPTPIRLADLGIEMFSSAAGYFTNKWSLITNSYSTAFRGIYYGADGVKNTGDDIRYYSGPGTFLVNEIEVFGPGESFTANTETEKEAVRKFISDNQPFHVGARYKLRTTNGEIVSSEYKVPFYKQPEPLPPPPPVVVEPPPPPPPLLPLPLPKLLAAFSVLVPSGDVFPGTAMSFSCVVSNAGQTRIESVTNVLQYQINSWGWENWTNIATIQALDPGKCIELPIQTWNAGSANENIEWSFQLKSSSDGCSAFSSVSKLRIVSPPPPPQIKIIVEKRIGAIEIVVDGPDGKYELQKSSDLLKWSTSMSTTKDGGELRFAVQTEKFGFFRVVRQ